MLYLFIESKITSAQTKCPLVPYSALTI